MQTTNKNGYHVQQTGTYNESRRYSDQQSTPLLNYDNSLYLSGAQSMNFNAQGYYVQSPTSIVTTPILNHNPQVHPYAVANRATTTPYPASQASLLPDPRPIVTLKRIYPVSFFQGITPTMNESDQAQPNPYAVVRMTPSQASQQRLLPKPTAVVTQRLSSYFLMPPPVIRGIQNKPSLTITRFYNDWKAISFKVQFKVLNLFTLDDFAEHFSNPMKKPSANAELMAQAEKLIDELQEALVSSEFKNTLTSKHISRIISNIGVLGLNHLLQPSIKSKLSTIVNLINDPLLINDHFALSRTKQFISIAMFGFTLMAHADLLPDNASFPMSIFIKIMGEKTKDPSKGSFLISGMLYNLGCITSYYPTLSAKPFSVDHLIQMIEETITASYRPVSDLANMFYGIALLAHKNLIQVTPSLSIVDRVLNMTVKPIAPTEDIRNLQKALQFMMDIKLITEHVYSDYLTRLNLFNNKHSDNDITSDNDTTHRPVYAVGKSPSGLGGLFIQNCSNPTSVSTSRNNFNDDDDEEYNDINESILKAINNG